MLTSGLNRHCHEHKQDQHDTHFYFSPITTPMVMKQMGPPQVNVKPIIAIPDLSTILESSDNDFDNQYAENWLKM